MTYPTRKPTELVTLPGFIGYWVLRGIARQIGVDARSGVLSARGLFRVWVARKWQQVPRPVRATLFAVGVTGRAVYRAGRYSDRTVAAGARHGMFEGREQHREHMELRAIDRKIQENAEQDKKWGRDWETDEYLRLHKLYYDTRDRVHAEREARRYEHRYGKAEGRSRFREDRELEGIQQEIDDNQKREEAAWRAAGKPRYTPESEEYLKLHDKYYSAVDRITAARARRAGEPSPPPKLGPDVTHMGTTPYRYHDYHPEEGDEGPPDPLIAASNDGPRIVSGYQPLEWGLARVDPDGNTSVTPFNSYDEANDAEGGSRYPWVPSNRGDGRPVPPMVYRHHEKGWICAATGWPLDQVSKTPNTTDGGTVMTASTSTGHGDVVSIADLRREYDRSAREWATITEQHSSVAADLRNEATSLEAAVGGIAGEHDAQTRAEASAALEAVTMAVQKHEEAAAAADNAHATFVAALQGLERHRPMEEAVASHPGVADRTAAYRPQ